MKCRVLVLGHGTLPEDILRTANMIYGEIEGITHINLPADQDMESYRAAIDEVIRTNCKEGILVIVDLFKGSPFLVASSVMKDYWDNNVELITGLNLPMMLQICNDIEDTSLDELKKNALNVSKESIIDFRETMNNMRRGHK